MRLVDLEVRQLGLALVLEVLGLPLGLLLDRPVGLVQGLLLEEVVQAHELLVVVLQLLVAVLLVVPQQVEVVLLVALQLVVVQLALDVPRQEVLQGLLLREHLAQLLLLGEY